MLKWFSIKHLRQFSVTVTDEFCSAYSPDEAHGKASKKIENKRVKATRELLRGVTEYQRKNRLWLYKKAKLCKLIQNQLSAHGYPDALVQKLGDDLVVRVTAGIKRPI